VPRRSRRAFNEQARGHARNLHHEVGQCRGDRAASPRSGIVVERVANADIWPTVLDLIGLPSLPGVDGKSLLPLIEHAAGIRGDVPQDLTARPIYSELDQSWGSPEVKSEPLVAVTQGDLRFFLLATQPEAPVLFDRTSDPRELKNVAAQRPEDATRLRKLAEGYLSESTSPRARRPEGRDRRVALEPAARASATWSA
jgi:arylsulfatase A-like enzyme